MSAASAEATQRCELCLPAHVVRENALAYVRVDNAPLSPGHVLVIPKRHVASFFEMTVEEQHAILALLNESQKTIQADGFNIGVNIGKAAGQNRMHVHVHLIPRYAGDVPDPRGGVRCVLAAR